MEFFSRAKRSAMDAYQSVMEQEPVPRSQTQGRVYDSSGNPFPEEAKAESKRERAKALGMMLTRKVTEGVIATSAAVSAAAQGAHDQMLLMKVGNTALEQQSAAAAADISCARVRLNIIGAVDLRESAGQLDAYCMVTVGKRGNPWGVKVAKAPFVKLPVCLRQRHPQWNVAYVLQLTKDLTVSASDPDDDGGLFPTAAIEPELTIRVMDAHTTRPDIVVGEARIHLSTNPSGAQTLRLLGGGFASISMRWKLFHVGEVDSGDCLGLQLEDKDLPYMEPSPPCSPTQSPVPSHSSWPLPPRTASAPSSPSAPFAQPPLSMTSAPASPPSPTSPPSPPSPDERHGETDETGAVAAAGSEAPVSAAWAALLVAKPFEAATAFWRRHWAQIASAGPAAEEQQRRRLSAGVQLLAETILNCDVGAAVLTGASGDIPEATHSFGTKDGQKLVPIRSSEASSPASQGLNELILQAPLSHIFSAPEEDLLAVMEALNVRIGLLGPFARSRVAVALEKMFKLNRCTDLFRDRAENLLLLIFTTAEGQALKELKQLIDTAGVGNDLLSLFGVLTRPGLRQALLAHFREDAEKFGERPIHVLSDIDMTVWVGTFGSGGPKFPSGPIPGAISLYGLLGGRITFLSARPPVWESKTRGALLDDIGIAEATVLQGTLKNVMMALVNKEEAHRGMGEQKQTAFNQFADLHPDARFIFFGDSGEGDVDFAINFMRPALDGKKRPPDRAALIHDVVGPDGTTPKTRPAERKQLASEGVYVFDTYIGAALRLYKLGLLDKGQLRLAAQNASVEFSAIPELDYMMPCIYRSRLAEFEHDMMAVFHILEASEETADDFVASLSVADSGFQEHRSMELEALVTDVHEAAASSSSAAVSLPLSSGKLRKSHTAAVDGVTGLAAECELNALAAAVTGGATPTIAGAAKAPIAASPVGEKGDGSDANVEATMRDPLAAFAAKAPKATGQIKQATAGLSPAGTTAASGYPSETSPATAEANRKQKATEWPESLKDEKEDGLAGQQCEWTASLADNKVAKPKAEGEGAASSGFRRPPASLRRDSDHSDTNDLAGW